MVLVYRGRDRKALQPHALPLHACVGCDRARAVHLSEHAEARMQIRGLRETDVEVILAHGTPRGDAVLLTGRDVAERVGELRKQIAQLQRLKGMAVFLADQEIVSVYRPRKWKLRKMLGKKASRRSRRSRRVGRA